MKWDYLREGFYQIIYSLITVDTNQSKSLIFNINERSELRLFSKGWSFCLNLEFQDKLLFILNKGKKLDDETFLAIFEHCALDFFYWCQEYIKTLYIQLESGSIISLFRINVQEPLETPSN